LTGSGLILLNDGMDSRYPPLPAHRRCGLPECWCTPPEPPKKDYGTREAKPNQRIVPRELDPWRSPAPSEPKR
jgi:hypothetical protein